MRRHRGGYSTKARGARLLATCWCVATLSVACADGASRPPVLTADMPLHLEDYLDAAVIDGSELPADPAVTMQWNFDEPQPEWRPSVVPSSKSTRVGRTPDALRVTLVESPTGFGGGAFGGGVYIELPDWREGDWSHAIVRMRTSSDVRNFGIGRNQAELAAGEPWVLPMAIVGSAPPVSDGMVHTYRVSLRGSGRAMIIDGQWGASMQIGPPSDDPRRRRPWPVLLFDVWADPLALRPINEERPDLVERYTALLEEQWEAHRALATRFTPSTQVTLTPEQLERLRTLGYIR